MQLKKILHFVTNLPICLASVIPLGSKVLADCHVTQLTSPCIFCWLAYLPIIFCMMCPSSHQPSERLVPGVGTVVPNNGCTCSKYHYSCSNVLLVARILHSSGILLCLPRTAPVNPLLVLFSVTGEHN